MHVVSVDKLGRTSPQVGGVSVLVGPEPAYGNIAGHVQDAVTGNPIAGATVSLNGGYQFVTTNAAGDYTFLGKVPVIGTSYRIRATAANHQPQELGERHGFQTAVVPFSLGALVGSNAGTYHLGWKYAVGDKGAQAATPAIAIAPGRARVWSTGGNNGNLEGQTGVTYSGGGNLYVSNIGFRIEPIRGTRRLERLELFRAGAWRSSPLLDMSVWGGDGALLTHKTLSTMYGVTTAAIVWNGSTYGVFFGNFHFLMFQEFTKTLQPVAASPLTVADFGSTITSVDDVAAVWDGTAYAVLALAKTAYFYRFGLDPSAGALKNVTLDTSFFGDTVALTYDGTQYHAAYARYISQLEADRLVRSIAKDGTVGPAVSFASNGTRPSLAFDGNLLLSYGGYSGFPAMLEVRSVVDHSLVQSFDLHVSRTTAVAADPSTGDRRAHRPR